MGASTIVWIILVVALLVAVIAIVASWSSARRRQAQRQQSADVRQKAVARDRRLRADEARASEADAMARLARADARTGELERAEGYDRRRTSAA